MASGSDEYDDASRRLPPVIRGFSMRIEREIIVGKISGRQRVRMNGSTMATTTTRLRAMGTCSEEAPKISEGRMKPSLRNGLTSHGAEEAGKIGNGYTLTSNGHVCDIVSIYSNVTVRAPLYALCQSSGNCDHLVLFFVRLALMLPINPVHRSLSSHMVKFYC